METVKRGCHHMFGQKQDVSSVNSSPYLLTQWSKVLLEKLISFQLLKKFPAFYGTQRFITAVTSAHHLSLSWANPIQSPQPLPTSWRYIVILSSHLRFGLRSGLFPSGFPTKTLCTPLPSSIRAKCPAHLILLDFITHTVLGEEYGSLSSSLCNFLHYGILYKPIKTDILNMKPVLVLWIWYNFTVQFCALS